MMASSTLWHIRPETHNSSALPQVLHQAVPRYDRTSVRVLRPLLLSTRLMRSAPHSQKRKLRQIGRPAAVVMGVASEDAEKQWDLLCTHHTGKWHGQWTTTAFGPKNEIEEIKEMRALTDVTISEDGTVCTVSRQNYDNGEPIGESRGGSIGIGKLPNRLIGPMYQGCVVAGARVVFEAGLSFREHTRLRIAVEYRREEASDSKAEEAPSLDVPKLFTVTVIQEQHGGFPSGNELHFFDVSTDPAQLGGHYCGDRYCHDGTQKAVELQLSDKAAMSTRGLIAPVGTWSLLSGSDDGSSDATAGTGTIRFPGRLWLSAPAELTEGNHELCVHWWPAEAELYCSTTTFTWPDREGKVEYTTSLDIAEKQM